MEGYLKKKRENPNKPQAKHQSVELKVVWNNTRGISTTTQALHNLFINHLGE